MVEALDDGLDGLFGHQRGVLADGSEIDEGQPGNLAVVVADYRYITGNVDAGPGEGVEDAVGAPVICREDGGRQLFFVEDVAAGGRTGLLGVVAGENPDLAGEAVPQHGLPVSTTALSGCGQVAAVDVHDAAVAETDQVVHGQPGAALVGYPDDINAVSGLPPSTVQDFLRRERRRLPTVEAICTFLKACGVDDWNVIAEWIYAWRRLRFAESEERRNRAPRALMSALPATGRPATGEPVRLRSVRRPSGNAGEHGGAPDTCCQASGW